MRLLVSWTVGLLCLGAPTGWGLRAEDPAPVKSPLGFAQVQLSCGATDAAKDKAVQGKGGLGEGWRAATPLDVALWFDPAVHPITVRFSLAGSQYAWGLTAYTRGDEDPQTRYVLNPEPPPPPGGAWPDVVVAAIRTDAQTLFTRGRLTEGGGGREGEELVESEFGSEYRLAWPRELEGRFGQVLPVATETFWLAGEPKAWGVRQTEEGLELTELESSDGQGRACVAVRR